MKCRKHNSEAIGICAYCGNAVCADCAKTSASKRTICSDECAMALARNEKAMELVLQKSLQTVRASAVYSFLCAGLSIAGAIGAKFYLPSPFLIWFCVGSSVVFIASGIWYSRVARKSSD